MMDRINMFSFLKEKNTVSNKNLEGFIKNRQPFSEIFKSKKESHGSHRKSTLLSSPKNELVINNRNKGNKSNPDVSNISNKQIKDMYKDTAKASDNQAEPWSKVTDEVSEGDIKGVKEESQSDEKVSTHQLEEESINHMASLLHSIHMILQNDTGEVEQACGSHMMWGIDEIDNLNTLVHELALLINTSESKNEILADETFRNTFETLNQIIADLLADDMDQTLPDKGKLSHMTSILHDLKNELETMTSTWKMAEDHLLQNQDMHGDVQLIHMEVADKSENHENTEAVEEAINLGDAKNSSKADNNHLEKLLSDQNNGSKDFLKEEAKGEVKIDPSLTLMLQQEKIDERINVNVLKNEVLEPKKFIGEIAQKAAAFLSKDKNEMTIQLTPENLGKISIKIGMNDGSLTGKIYTENYSVKEIIETELNQLKESLQEKGLNITGLEVHIGNSEKEFNRNLFQGRYENRQKVKGITNVSKTTFITASQEMNEVNPYLIEGQFEGLV